MKKLLFFWKSNTPVVGEPSEPRGVHHTVSYASSYEETWAHIRREARSIQAQSANLTPKERVLA
uniref:Uncharacterized protein n=1 Tax=Roseihalotalea indica TaxID=2867963 RepID=A0AA49GRI7_9BACT|nr:hypothetical protein K4G66_13280 [Tunicatimonas sp. TK19036]